MFTTLLGIIHRPTDQSQDDDGACAACDHPFEHMNHFCFGSLSVTR